MGICFLVGAESFSNKGGHNVFCVCGSSIFSEDRFSGFSALTLTAFIMLIYQPMYLFDVGFQLSYLAVFFILFLVPRFKEWIVVRNPLLAMPWEWITVSIAAQIGTALLCFYYFGQFSTVFLFTNLPVTLLAMFLIPFAFCG